MIMVTRLNGEQLMVNADMIEFIEVTPDTVVSTVTGKKIIVTEDLETVKDRIVEYKRKIYSAPMVINRENE